MTSYQKLKEENYKLRQDIYNLVVETEQTPIIKMNYTIKFAIERQIFIGCGYKGEITGMSK